MCSECVQNVFRVCLECVQSVFRVVQSVFRVCSEYVQGWLSRFVVKIGCQDRLTRLVVKIVVIASSSAPSMSVFAFFVTFLINAQY